MGKKAISRTLPQNPTPDRDSNLTQNHKSDSSTKEFGRFKARYDHRGPSSNQNSSSEQNLILDRIIRVPECEHLTGLSNVSLWRLEREGEFPKRLKLTAGGTVGWKLSSVMDWINSRSSA